LGKTLRVCAWNEGRNLLMSLEEKPFTGEKVPEKRGSGETEKIVGRGGKGCWSC